MCGVYEQACGIPDTLLIVGGTSVGDVVFIDRIMIVTVEMRSTVINGVR
jgi:hypothetical protein